MEDDNPLTELYLNLLERAIDKERQDEAHPAFVKIIEQMSPDEAMVVHEFRKSPNIFIYSVHREPVGWAGNGGSSPEVRLVPCSWCHRETLFPIEKLAQPSNLEMYLNHLQSLNLCDKKEVDAQEFPRPGWITEFLLGDFGELFIKACIPEDFKLERGKNEEQAVEGGTQG
jgi:hypothetical protein